MEKEKQSFSEKACFAIKSSYFWGAVLGGLGFLSSVAYFICRILGIE